MIDAFLLFSIVEVFYRYNLRVETRFASSISGFLILMPKESNFGLIFFGLGLKLATEPLTLMFDTGLILNL